MRHASFGAIAQVDDLTVENAFVSSTSNRYGDLMSGYLNGLEAESIEVIRETIALAQMSVMMYSIGKDSSVMLHLAKKAFWRAVPPFPLLHVDTTWKFPEMIAFCNQIIAESGMKLVVHTNYQRIAEGVDPFTYDSDRYSTMIKTEALKRALDVGGFDFILDEARRDEEKARAKGKLLFFRAAGHRWNPKLQRPELWNVYNARINLGESIRVFPLLN
jgi:sulfate adenylyltransferase subunit 2